jgi:hypothetical protein
MRVVIQHFIYQQLQIITKTVVVQEASKITQNFIKQISNNASGVIQHFIYKIHKTTIEYCGL